MLQQLPELLERAVAAIAGIAVTNTKLRQSLGSLLRAQSCSNRWDCCHEHRVAAIAGIAVLKRCGRSWILPFIVVAADAGFCR